MRTSFVYTAQHVNQAIEEMLNACEIDKQQVDVILLDNVRNMKKQWMIWRYQLWAASQTLKLDVHEVLLSQCSVTDSPANKRKVEGQCWNSICRIRKSHMKVFTLFQQNEKMEGMIEKQCRYFFS